MVRTHIVFDFITFLLLLFGTLLSTLGKALGRYAKRRYNKPLSRRGKWLSHTGKSWRRAINDSRAMVRALTAKR